MAIAMVAAVIVIQTFSNNQVFARATQGASDAQQTGNVLSRYLSRTLEESGSALSAAEGIWGCQLSATIAGANIHPRAAAYPIPFQFIPVPLRLAPVIAISGGASGGNPNIDTLVVSIGRPSGSSQDLGATFFNTELNVSPNPAIGFNPNDFLLTYPPLAGAANVNNCNLVRVAATFTPTALRPVLAGIGARPIGRAPNSVPLAANFGTPPNTDAPFFVRNIGQAPVLTALTVDANSSFMSLNLLTNNPAPQILAENVVALRVLYGFDADNNNVISNAEWREPTGALAPATLLNGTQASASIISQIIAVRINYVVRSSQTAGYDGGNQTVALFPDMVPAIPPIVMVGDAARYQYQVFDVTVPLHNPRAL